MKKKNIKKYILILTVIALYAFIINITKINCPIRYILGLPCPFCGTTRALISFLNGNIKQAFYYHPLFILSIPFLILLITSNEKYFFKMNRKTRTCILSFIAILYIAIYIIRMIFFYIP
ncbi:DUF2752 domain-containing protein [Anaerofustis butyriciformans]|uniref:DUF2752 domain-containing protein n=1 Tax=Anaerofustis butyriciformans TaxID=3108533 RepID=UPI003CC95C16